jgi:hypothetical protein
MHGSGFSVDVGVLVGVSGVTSPGGSGMSKVRLVERALSLSA